MEQPKREPQSDTATGCPPRELHRDVTSATPKSLLQRMRDTNSESDWRQLYRLYAPLIRHWLDGFGISGPDADDLIQEVFLTLVKELPSFEHNGRVGAFRNWLRTTLVFRLKAISRTRKTKTSVSTELTQTVLNDLEDLSSAPNLKWDREHDQFVMRQLLEQIEPEFRARRGKHSADNCSTGSLRKKLPKSWEFRSTPC